MSKNEKSPSKSNGNNAGQNSKTFKLVMIRHGQSTSNKDNLFTGWTDVDLTQEGIEEANMAGEILKNSLFNFDICFTSSLKRSINTASIILEKIGQSNIPIRKDFHLNERHYGAIQGLNKKDMAMKYGKKLVKDWRRSYSISPPKLDENDSRNPANDEEYKSIDRKDLPLTESLRDMDKRVIPYFIKEIAPEIKNGKNILLITHGNTMRGLVKYFDKISDEDIANVDIPNSTPLVYEFNENLEAIKNYYLGEENNVKEKFNKIKNLENQVDEA